MLRVIQSQNATAAKSYYTQSLSKEDYYSQSQEIIGEWGGKASDILGLRGQVEKQAFDALCDNMNPSTGKRLTVRTNKERRVGYDLNFHCPKSVSAVYALTNDERILTAFRDAVRETMQDLESEMQARIRKDGQKAERVTGNMAWAEFVHFTARPVGGLPDPHLHAHCFAFNATFDKEENKWKAGEFGTIKRDAPFYEAGFHARLAGKLSALGYGIKRNTKSWELSTVPKTVIDKFSRRTAEIEAIAQEKNISSAKAKDGLGAKTRQGKYAGQKMDALKTLWLERLTDTEKAAVFGAKDTGGGSPFVSNSRAVDFAIAKEFERASVIDNKRLMATALRYGVGSVSVEAVKREAMRGDILGANINGRLFSTTKRVIAEEKEMIESAKNGRGKFAPLVSAKLNFSDERLSYEQKAAVLHVWQSRDFITGIRGGAGVGKTTLMTEAVRGIEQNGKKVFVFAPTAEASRGVLRSEGFGNAETVAKLLVDKDTQSKINGQVLWIDEAGLVGSRTMGKVLNIAKDQNARVILSGDVRQHNAVERGDALRLLETQAGIKTATIGSIRRQRGTYKEAVEAISKGNTAKGFETLDKLGWVVEESGENRYQSLANDYTQAVKRGKSALVVSPTHKEGEKVTDSIRSEMRKQGLLSDKERNFTRLRNLSLTDAEKSDSRHYESGLVVHFHRGAGDFKRGESVKISGVSSSGGVETKDTKGNMRHLPLDKSNNFQVFAVDKVGLAAGDAVRITQNGYTQADKDNRQKHYLANGSIYRVKNFTKQGHIELQNGWVVPQNYGGLTHGYCTTSHAAQGKTVDRVFIAQSADSFRATSKEQFYVSVSRGRESVKIYTDDKKALKSAVLESSARMSATELMNDKKPNLSQKLKEHGQLVNRLATLAKSYAAEKARNAKDTVAEKAKNWSNKVADSRQNKGLDYER